MGKRINEFKQFAVKGNAVDMAVGVIIGGAFGKIVSSIVNDLIMPPIGWLIGGVNFTAHGLRLDPHPAVHIRTLDHDLRPAEVENILLRPLYGKVIDLLMRLILCLKADARL